MPHKAIVTWVETVEPQLQMLIILPTYFSVQTSSNVGSSTWAPWRRFMWSMTTRARHQHGISKRSSSRTGTRTRSTTVCATSGCRRAPLAESLPANKWIEISPSKYRPNAFLEISWYIHHIKSTIENGLSFSHSRVKYYNWQCIYGILLIFCFYEGSIATFYSV